MLGQNAKLYLMATILRGLSFGIWGVIFYLYLNLGDVGFQPDFIGNMFTVGAIATGLVALPAGLVYERIGPRKAMLIGLTSNIISIIQIFTLHPSILLSASLISGLIGTLGWVAAAPFMMESSTEEERTHLFSINWALMTIIGVFGSYIGGVLPDLFNSLLHVSTGVDGSPLGYRIALLISVALALIAGLPILLIKEKNVSKRQRMVDLLSFRNIKSHWTILKFMIPACLIGFGAGFIVPLSNIFFKLKFLASTEQIGIISAVSSVALGIGTLSAPVISSRLGKVRSVAVCQYLSMPFIMLITSSPNLTLASTAFVSRASLMNMAGPINSTLQMELVSENERGTTNGLMIMSDNIPRALTASFSGSMMAGSDFFTPFMNIHTS